ncbi:MAG: HAMP domain-containing sensor histidine kinase [Acidobacteriota bacterium]
MRLFWKILGGYFLAWALFSAALFGALILDSQTEFLPRSGVSQALPSRLGVQMGAANLRSGGEEVFRRLAENWRQGKPPYVVDPEGRELLGRDLDAATVELARSLAVETERPAVAQRVQALSGVRYVVFYPDGEGPADQSPARWFLEWPWLLAIVFAMVGLLLAAGLTASWVRPIAGLESAFEALTESGGGDLKVEVDPSITGRRDEIGDLGRHFEAMARRLARSIGAQRQLLHDVSHEIRSPLARLSVATHLARRRPDRLEEALDRIDKEARRLDGLIGEVLTLARLEDAASRAEDSEAAEGSRAPAGASGGSDFEDYFDLAELLRVIRDDVAFEADAVGIEVILRVPEAAEPVIRGNAELLHRAVENVVRNALQHARGAGAIEILLETPDSGGSGGILLRVRNRGSGPADRIEEEILATLFEPFRRGRESAGFGLGLAIARRAVEAHGGEIQALGLAEGGMEVRITLPSGALGMESPDKMCR